MGEGAILMNTETGDCFELNRVGAQIWKELEEGRSIDDIAAIVAERHAVDQSVVFGDVAKLIDRLLQHGILFSTAS